MAAEHQEHPHHISHENGTCATQVSMVGHAGSSDSVDVGGKPKKLAHQATGCDAKADAKTPFGGKSGGQDTKIVKELMAVHEIIQKGYAKEVVYWIHSTTADSLFGIVIVLNTAFIGVEVDLQSRELADTGPFNWLWCLNSIFLALFWLEIGLRLRADGLPRFFKSWWGSFDFSVTSLGALDTWAVTPAQWSGSDAAGGSFSSLMVLRIFRILRLIRVLRLLRVFKELVLLVRTLGEALRAVFWTAGLLMVVVYVGGVLCTLLISPNIVGPTREEYDLAFGKDPLSSHISSCNATNSSASAEPDDLDACFEYFGTLSRSLYTHFVLITTEKWTDIVAPVLEIHGSFWAAYFIGYIMVTNFSLLNMVIAVITEKILALGQEEPPREQLADELEAFRACMMAVFANIDADNSKCLTQEELRRFFEDRQFRRVLEAFEVNCSMPFEYIWPIIDVDGDGIVSFDEFMTACLRLRGSRGKANFQVLMLQCDVMKLTQRLHWRQEALHTELTERLDNFEELLKQLMLEDEPDPEEEEWFCEEPASEAMAAMSEEEAAVLIQSMHRGRKARRIVAGDSCDNTGPPQSRGRGRVINEGDAALLIQSRQRGRKARAQVAQARTEHCAAVSIQAAHRGRGGRRAAKARCENIIVPQEIGRSSGCASTMSEIDPVVRKRPPGKGPISL